MPKQCQVDGCLEPYRCSGYCGFHYARWLRGAPLDVPAYHPRRMSAEERFWQKVEKTETCWLWTAGKNDRGYGHFWRGDRDVPAHQFSYELAYGPIAEGLEIDHLCRVHGCVRPDHLEAVTHRVNIQRGEAGAHNRARQTCKYGHPFDAPRKVGERVYRGCRECNNRRSREYSARLRNALSKTPKGA